MGRQLTRQQKAELVDVLKANGLGPCDHPDCDPRQPSCASNYVHLRALSAVTVAYQLGNACKPDRA